MKLKQKLLLSLGTLFVLTALMGILSAYSINRLTADTQNILKANYNSVAYSREMLLALDGGFPENQAAKAFFENLALQQQNITEAGEDILTRRLADDAAALQKRPSDSLYKEVRKDIVSVMTLNMEAIRRKSERADATAAQALAWVTLAGGICFIIGISLLVNLPGSLANPIRELTESMKRIAGRNYAERIHSHRTDEFGEMAASFNTMAEKLEEYNSTSLARVMTEKRRMEALISALDEPVLGLDEEQRVLYMNEAALRIANLPSGNVVGKSLQELALHNDLLRLLAQDLYGAKGSHEPLKIYADGKESYFHKQTLSIDLIPTGEKEARHAGNMIFLKNITAFKELDFAKTHFMATVSHELKTPLSSIRLSTQLLENERVGTLNQEQKELLQSIQDDTARLLKITGELLNITQIESGQLQLLPVPCHPEYLITQAIGINKTAAESKGIAVHIDLREPLPNIMADADKTVWIVSNLISNAIRYSYDDSAISVQARPVGPFVAISVSDTGQGIAPQYRTRIFDRYFRVPGSRREGTGLGLAISKELIETMGGTITVKSDYGAGSTFEIRLPAV